MKSETIQGIAATITVTKSAEEAYQAINNVRGWWSLDIDGVTDQLGAEWDYRYQDKHFTKLKVTELVPGKRVAWKVLSNKFTFFQGPDEWTGTTIQFDIEAKGQQTEVRFIHQGLAPSCQCYDVCTNAWTMLVKESLKDLIEKGQGKPLARG